MTDDPRWKAVKAHIAKGDKAKDKAEQHYIAAGQYLVALKAEHTGTWAQWESKCKERAGIGKSRASELMAIADGTKTTKQVRADTNKRKITHRTSPFRNGETRRERQRKANAERDRDREACIALDQKVKSAERELAQWRADHPDPVVAEWLKGGEPTTIANPVTETAPPTGAPPSTGQRLSRKQRRNLMCAEIRRLAKRLVEVAPDIAGELRGIFSGLDDHDARFMARVLRQALDEEINKGSGAEGNDVNAQASADQRKTEFAARDDAGAITGTPAAASPENGGRVATSPTRSDGSDPVQSAPGGTLTIEERAAALTAKGVQEPIPDFLLKPT